MRLQPHHSPRYQIDDQDLFRQIVAAAFTTPQNAAQCAANADDEAGIEEAGQAPGHARSSCRSPHLWHWLMPLLVNWVLRPDIGGVCPVNAVADGLK